MTEEEFRNDRVDTEQGMTSDHMYKVAAAHVVSVTLLWINAERSGDATKQRRALALSLCPPIYQLWPPGAAPGGGQGLTRPSTLGRAGCSATAVAAAASLPVWSAAHWLAQWVGRCRPGSSRCRSMRCRRSCAARY